MPRVWSGQVSEELSLLTLILQGQREETLSLSLSPSSVVIQKLLRSELFHLDPDFLLSFHVYLSTLEPGVGYTSHGIPSSSIEIKDSSLGYILRQYTLKDGFS
ncbi:hypothetical protein SDJN03_29301, partial [Cucurbita argyrosperma subsp. sororia]